MEIAYFFRMEYNDNSINICRSLPGRGVIKGGTCMNRKAICVVCAMLLIFAVSLSACGTKEPVAGTTAGQTVPSAEVAAPELSLTEWSLSASTWSSPNGATIHLTAVPTRHAEGDSASFVVRLEGEEIASVPCSWENNNYTAEVDLNAADGYCYYVTLSGADGAAATAVKFVF